MKLVVPAAGLTVFALVALLLLGRTAPVTDFNSCDGPAAGFVPQSCVHVPTSASVRRDAGALFVSVATTRADLRVEVGMPESDVLRLAAAVELGTEWVERAFRRPFAPPPRVLVFATPATFARALEDLFGYPPVTARELATSYGGVLDPQSLTIAVNLGAAADKELAGLITHELAHLATREIVGSASLPAWVDEGIATMVEQDAEGGASDDDRLVGRSVLASGHVDLAELATLTGWYEAHARLGSPVYVAAAEAIRLIEEPAGDAGFVLALGLVAGGDSFADAIARVTGEDAGLFAARLGRELDHPGIAVGDIDTDGDRAWTLYAFTPDSSVVVTISDEVRYRVTFVVGVDEFGMYRGSFGSTAPAGSYLISAADDRIASSLVTARMTTR